jgi:predicted negative regulator of RcsB-dependent stress response
LKRNLIVILVVVVALGLMAWSGYQNLQRRRAAQNAKPPVTALDQSNQTVQQDVASVPAEDPGWTQGFARRLQGQSSPAELLGHLVRALQAGDAMVRGSGEAVRIAGI